MSAPRRPGRDTTATSRRAADPAAAEARLQAAHDTLTVLVEGLQTGQDWQRALATAARFHRYSFGNALLIAASHARAFAQGRVPDPLPDLVAGYRTWQALGRHVIRGQTGHTILAPRTRTIREASDDAGTRRELARGEHPGSGESATTRHAVVGWTTTTVFSMSQTDGEPLALPPEPRLLVGQAPPGLWDALGTQVAAAGYTLTSAPDAAALGGANGVTDFTARTVSVREDMDAAARVKTLAHELGHVLLHAPDAGADPTAWAREVHGGVREVEAESVAYLIAHAHGMDTTAYTLPYVAGWAGGTDPAATVRATAERVVRTARGILDTLPTDHGLGGQPPGLERILDARQASARAGRRPAVTVPERGAAVGVAR